MAAMIIVTTLLAGTTAGGGHSLLFVVKFSSSLSLSLVVVGLPKRRRLRVGLLRVEWCP